MTKVVGMIGRAKQAARNAGITAAAQHQNAIEKLPFVGMRKGDRTGVNLPRDFWHNVKSTGDMEKDQAFGSACAYLALQAIKADNFAPLLGWIVLDMITNKCPEHIVIGFFQTVADVCLGYHQIPPAEVRLVVPAVVAP
jgi:hypothetical protein